MDLYVRICEVAKRQGFSINRLEKECGFARSYISKFKTITPGTDKIQKIAEVLNVNIEELLGSSNISYDSDSKTWGTDDSYYENKETDEYADFLRTHPEHKILFDAVKSVKKEDLAKALRAIGIFTEE